VSGSRTEKSFPGMFFDVQPPQQDWWSDRPHPFVTVPRRVAGARRRSRGSSGMSPIGGASAGGTEGPPTLAPPTWPPGNAVPPRRGGGARQLRRPGGHGAPRRARPASPAQREPRFPQSRGLEGRFGARGTAGPDTPRRRSGTRQGPHQGEAEPGASRAKPDPNGTHRKAVAGLGQQLRPGAAGASKEDHLSPRAVGAIQIPTSRLDPLRRNRSGAKDEDGPSQQRAWVSSFGRSRDAEPGIRASPEASGHGRRRGQRLVGKKAQGSIGRHSGGNAECPQRTRRWNKALRSTGGRKRTRAGASPFRGR
jgi:hypothetical protein